MTTGVHCSSSVRTKIDFKLFWGRSVNQLFSTNSFLFKTPHFSLQWQKKVPHKLSIPFLEFHFSFIICLVLFHISSPFIIFVIVITSFYSCTFSLFFNWYPINYFLCPVWSTLNDHCSLNASCSAFSWNVLQVPFTETHIQIDASSVWWKVTFVKADKSGFHSAIHELHGTLHFSPQPVIKSYFPNSVEEL